MQYLPIFLDAQKINAVIIGGGEIAARKLELLVKTAANITLIAPTLALGCRQQIRKHPVRYINDSYQHHYISEEVNLVIAATDDKQLNTDIAKRCQQQNILVNVVDSPRLCSYITPAIIDRDPLCIALSSSGSAPMLLQLVKQQLNHLLPADLGKLAKFMGKHRHQVQAHIADFASRRNLWQQVIQSNITDAIFTNNEQLAEQRFNALISSHQAELSYSLHVIKLTSEHADDLTLRAYRILQSCDAVFFARELMPLLADYCRKDAEKLEGLSIEQISEYHQQMNIAVIIKEDKAYQQLKQQLAVLAKPLSVSYIYTGS